MLIKSSSSHPYLVENIQGKNHRKSHVLLVYVTFSEKYRTTEFYTTTSEKEIVSSCSDVVLALKLIKFLKCAFKIPVSVHKRTHLSPKQPFNTDIKKTILSLYNWFNNLSFPPDLRAVTAAVRVFLCTRFIVNFTAHFTVTSLHTYFF